MSIMIVDDDLDSSQAMKIMIEKRGIRTVVVPSAEEGLAYIRSQEYDAAIMDIRLPGMDGVDLLRHIRHEDPDFPVVMFTGYDSIETAVACLRLGVSDYLVKPLDGIEQILNPAIRGVRARRLARQGRQIEEHVRRSECELRAIIETLPDIVFQIDVRQNTFVHISPSVRSVLGFAVDRFLNQDIRSAEELIHPDDAAAFRAWIRPAGDRGLPALQEFRARHQDGGYRWLEFARTMVRDANGRPTDIVGSARDVTELRSRDSEWVARDERSRRAERLSAVVLMTRRVARDLNHLVFPLIGLPDVLLPGLVWPMTRRDLDDIRSALLDVARAGGTATELIHDLILLSQHPAPGRIRVVDLNQLARDFLGCPALSEVKHAHPGLTLIPRLTDGVLPVRGSPGGLIGSLLVAVRIAAELSPHDGAIEFSTGRTSLDAARAGYETIPAGDYATLTVAAPGAELSDEALDRLFLGCASVTESPGSCADGLGLLPVYAMVKEHGGAMDAAHIPGQGTAFTLYFPIAAEPLDRAPGMPLSRDIGHGKTLLLVDDTPLHLELTARALRSLGYTVATAASGQDAIELAQAQIASGTPRDAAYPFDLVLLDVVLRGGPDGVEVYKNIVSRWPAQPCIMIRAFPENERVRTAVQLLGVARFVQKPYTLEQLADAVRAVLNPHEGGAAETHNSPGNNEGGQQ